jgi:hypothetical protein
VSKLFGYDFTFEYLPRKVNTVTNALSWRDKESAETLAMPSPSFALFDDLQREMHKLEDGQHLLEMTAKDEATMRWSVASNLSVYSGRIFILMVSPIWLAILATAHGVRHVGT